MVRGEWGLVLTRYVALLRGVNVGGKNKVVMSELRVALEEAGFRDVVSYINSGNLLFDSELGVDEVASVCERVILDSFGVDVRVVVLTADELVATVEAAPDWWGVDAGVGAESKHNAIVVIDPLSAAEACELVGVRPEYESVAWSGRVIFWSAPLATFSRTAWQKAVTQKTVYDNITIRNANTMRRLAEMAGGVGDAE
jgi:uncharacterized protein (DUF1697 family)